MIDNNNYHETQYRSVCRIKRIRAVHNPQTFTGANPDARRV